METKDYFKLYANCLPVKGHARSLICDLQRNNYEFIPNDLLELFGDAHYIDVPRLKQEFDAEDAETIEEYLQLLLEKEFGFYCDAHELALLPKLSLGWDFPSLISNAIVDVDEHSKHNYTRIFSQLEEAGCRHIQVRIYHAMPFDELQELIALANTFPLWSIDLITRFHSDLSKEEVIRWAYVNRRIRALYLHGSDVSEIWQYPIEAMGLCVKLAELISDETHCGAVHPSYFAINMESFTEALQFNSCLNRKLSVDKKGNIRNCPSMPANYGHIDTTDIRRVIDRDDFRKTWSITKDQVDTCMDCEFRYICTDCRVYTKDNHFHSKPAKCGYDPYTAEWDFEKQKGV